MAVSDGAGQGQLHGASVDRDSVNGRVTAIDLDDKLADVGRGGIQGFAIGENHLGAIAAGGR